MLEESLYEDFKERIKKNIIFRAKNFVTTDCDFDMLIDTVYNEITNDVYLGFSTNEIILKKDILMYVLDNEAVEELEEGDLSNYSIYGPTTDIVDSNFYDISLYVINNNPGEYIFPYDYIDKNQDSPVYIKRVLIENVKKLSNAMYKMLFPAMMEGILFYIQDAIPSQVDSQIGNLHYQRFHAKKEILRDKLPQHERFDGRQVGSVATIGENYVNDSN